MRLVTPGLGRLHLLVQVDKHVTTRSNARHLGGLFNIQQKSTLLATPLRFAVRLLLAK